MQEQKEEKNIGEIIDIALEKIENANKEKLENVFRNVSFNSEANLGKTKTCRGKGRVFCSSRKCRKKEKKRGDME